MKFPEGKLLGDRYEVVCPIDHGKFGQVLKCKDKRSKNKIVAAKISNVQSFDVDNAKVESKLLERLAIAPKKDK